MESKLTRRENYGQTGSTYVGEDGVSIDMEVANRVLRNSYAYMCLALLISGVVGYLFAINEDLINGILGMGRIGIFLLMGIQLGIVWYLAARIDSMTVSTGLAWFLLYAATTGITLSFYIMIYTGESIATIFFTTAFIFGSCSAYGYFTKKNIMGWSKWIIVALVGLVLSIVVNIFLQSEGVMYFISAITVLLFCGITAYDTQKLLVLSTMANNREDEGRIAIIGALNLYLDFINMFLALLRLFGSKK